MPDRAAGWAGAGVRRLGMHGFLQGGLLVEAGQSSSARLAPLVARAELPENWRVLLVIPADEQGWHGPREIEAFASSPARTDRHSATPCAV